jgi:hypothetical protein
MAYIIHVSIIVRIGTTFIAAIERTATFITSIVSATITTAIFITIFIATFIIIATTIFIAATV